MKEAYLSFWRGFLDFKGQSTRSEYWIPTLVHLALYIVGYLLILFTKDSEVPFAMLIIIALIIFGLIAITPTIAVTIRRFHDAGRHGKILIIYYVLSFMSGALEDMNNFLSVLLNGLFVIMAIYVFVITVLPSRHVSPDHRSYI